EIKEEKDGKISIKAKISHEMELFPIIMQWLPEIQLQSPAELKEKLKEKMSGVLAYINENFEL
ncbi:MAG: WYL domain-containing protein, partial [Elusimicrobiales bacterium]|nr:WYL domain-containing protein [Elusimicrobiales bacterium]